MARERGASWRLEGVSTTQIDGVIALAMAVERAEVKPETVRLLGWL
jgi:hypothetical protein